MKQVVLITGSNLGDPTGNLERARLEVSRGIGNIVLVSGIYESSPWGFEHENPFLNQVLVIHTEFAPLEVLNRILEIEKGMGRTRDGKGYQARLIDIDILFYNDQVVDNGFLKVPHPLLQDRRFVLEPLVEVLPDFVHPVIKEPNKALLANCPDTSTVKKISEA